MGVAGVALMYGFISFFKLIGAISRWSSWKSKGVLCPAVVVELKNTVENYKNKKNVTQYQYRVAVDYKDPQSTGIYPLADFEKIIQGDIRSDIAIGKEIKLFYNPQKGVCKDPDDLKSDITSNLGALVACIIIFFACFLIAEAIG